MIETFYQQDEKYEGDTMVDKIVSFVKKLKSDVEERGEVRISTCDKFTYSWSEVEYKAMTKLVNMSPSWCKIRVSINHGVRDYDVESSVRDGAINKSLQELM